jgi:hypothetical protein
MRIFQSTTVGFLLVMVLCGARAHGQITNSTLTGQWDFNQGNLNATVGTPLQYYGTSAASTTFESVVINGMTANVMRFGDDTQGFLLQHGAASNGLGTNLNQYTVVLDLMWPAESDGTFRALLNSDTNNVEEPMMFVNPDNAIGVNNEYSGSMNPGTWYRLALSFNLTNSTVTKYLNGEIVGTQLLDAGVDSRYSLKPALLLFASNLGEIRAGYVDRIQFYSDALSDEQVGDLGTPIGDGGPPVSGDVRIDSIRAAGTNMEITLSGGGTLQLQRKTRLSDAAWQSTGQQVNGSGTVTVPATDATGFFRAQRL